MKPDMLLVALFVCALLCELSFASLAISSPTIAIGATQTLSASASGGISPYSFNFLVYNPSGALAYNAFYGLPSNPSIPITLTNYQTANAVAGLQVIVNFNALSYAPYEASDLGNIRFYNTNAPANPANALYSWCEQGCSSTASNSVFWVKLSNPLTSTLNLNMTFLPTNTEYDGNVAGEAPQLSITGTTNSYSVNPNKIVYTTNILASAGDTISMTTALAGSTNYWLCGTAQSTGGSAINYIPEAGDGIDNIALLGYNTTNSCSGIGTEGQFAGAMIDVNTLVVPHFYYTSIANSGGGYNFGFTTTSNSFTVIMIMCGYTGGCTPAGGGAITGIPSACNKPTTNSVTTGDLGASASVYICNSLPASTYNIGINAGGGDADWVAGAWVFYNTTTVATGYAKYDNGNNIFNFYMNANSIPTSLPAPFEWGSDETDQTLAENSLNDLIQSYVAGESALMVKAIQLPIYGDGNGNEYVYFVPSNNLPQSFIATIWGYTTAGGGTSFDVGMAGNALQSYAGYYALSGDNAQNQMSLFWDTLASRIIKSNAGTGAFQGYNAWTTTGLEYNSTSHMFSTFYYPSFGLEANNIYASVADTASTTFNSYAIFGGYVYPYFLAYAKYYGIVTIRTYPPNGILPSESLGSLQLGAGGSTNPQSFSYIQSGPTGLWTINEISRDSTGAVVGDPMTYLVIPGGYIMSIQQGHTAVINSAGASNGTPPYAYQWFGQCPSCTGYNALASGPADLNSTRTTYYFNTDNLTQTGIWAFMLQAADSANAVANSLPVGVDVVAASPAILIVNNGYEFMALGIGTGITLAVIFQKKNKKSEKHGPKQ